MDEEKIEARLSRPIDWREQYLWAILSELRALRQALAPEEPASETIKLREGEGKE